MDKAPNKKVYFAGAIRGDRAMAETFREIIRHIQSQGLPVLTEHIAFEKPNEMLASKIGKAYADLTVEDIEQQDISWIDEATHVIAEVSGASTGTGREIEYARSKEHFGKTPAKILCLYHAEQEANVSAMISGMTPGRYPNITVRAYTDAANAKVIIDEFLNG